ncbi:hypothetical protein ES703_52597 [subsurface metagenome]
MRGTIDVTLMTISRTSPTSQSQRTNRARSAPKQPHFHDKILTTKLQPERPLSANFSKMSTS